MLSPFPEQRHRNFHKGIIATIVSLAVTLLIPSLSHAQSSVDATIRVTATTSPTKPYITLNWPAISGATGNVTIYRRAKGSSTWVSIATPAANALAYADNDSALALGVAYEYSLRCSSSTVGTATGAIVAGSNIPIVESRGKVILLVDSSMTTSLSSEIKQLEQNIVADGWTLFRHDVARQAIAASSVATTDYAPRLAELQAVRTLIQNTYNTNGGGTDWALFILGHVPVPYSGQLYPDGHGTHYGAWPTDTYYADINGTWTDTSANTTDANLSDARNYNHPGDGKFDQNTIASDLELQTGRVDLANMNNVSYGMNETEKLRLYLLRNHRFRRNLAPYTTVARRGLVDDNFGYFGGEAFSSSGWRAGFSFFGNGAGKMDSLDWFGTLGTTPMLMAYGCGGGSLTSSGGIGYSATDFNFKSSKAVFNVLFGSWFGDFDAPDNFLRAPLAGTSDSLGLTSVWSGRPYFHLHHMALGEIIGYSTRFTQNMVENTAAGSWFHNSSTTTNYKPSRAVTLNLMGDPTLRLHSVAPPTKVTATSGAGGITLNWLASPDSGLSGYHVYRATSPTGPFTRITGTTADGANPTGTCLSTATLTYTDTDSALAAGTAYTYLVKTVKMETSASGTYANQSVGEAVTLTHLAATPAPATPTRLTFTRTSGTAAQLTWDDNATDETAYLLERRNPATGVWSQLVSLAAGTTTYTDSTLAIGSIYHYRVRAANGTLYSDYSAETSDYNLPGMAGDTLTISYLTTKTSGTVNVSPRRYNGSAGPVTVNYTTSNIYGAAGTDYTATSGTVTWNNGESGPKSAPIPLLAPTGTQSTKIFKVTYTSPTNGLALSTLSTSYVFIRDSAALVLPSPWLSAIFGNTSPDIGYYEVANGNYGLALRSNGWACDTSTSTGDSMRFFYQPITGDFQITARLNYLSATGVNVRAGVMVRESITAKAPMNALLLSNSLACSRYSRTSSNSGGVLATPSVYAPSTTHWLRITRTGTTYASEQSANGTTWAPAATSISIPAINATAYVGLAMSTDPTTGDVGALGYARLDNVTLYTPPTPVATLTSGNGTASGQITLTWSASTAATSYRIERSLTTGTGFTLLATVAAPTLSYTDTALTPNTTYYYRVQAINPAYTTTAYSPETSLTPYISPTVNGWRYTYFGTEAATGNAAPTADPDRDGLNNLLEYALGLNPTTPNSPSSLPTAQIQTSGPDKVLTYTFVRNKNATDLTYLIEVTSDPSGIWTSFDPFNVSNQLNNLDNSPSNGLQTITVKDTQNTSAATQRFIRLRITGP